MLIQHLKIGKFIENNRQSKTPFNSILEVIVQNIKLGKKTINRSGTRTSLNIRRHNPPTLLALSHLKSLHNDMNAKGQYVDFLTLIRHNCGCSGQKCNVHFEMKNCVQYMKPSSYSGEFYKGNKNETERE